MAAPEAGLSRREFFKKIADRAQRGARFGHWQQVFDNTVDGILWDVWAASPEHMFAVGDNGTILHFDGQRWRSQPSNTGLPLHAVWGYGTDQAFAVGWMGVICHYRNGAWRRVQGSVTDAGTQRFVNSRENQPLFGLWADAPDNVWAVGDYGRIIHFDGSVWQEIDSGVSIHLRAISGLEDGTLLACGAQGLVLCFDGKRWQALDTGTGTHFTRLWARSPTEIYAIGGQYNVHANRFVGSVHRYDGHQWQAIPTPDGPPERLRAMAGDAEQLILVGDRGSIYTLGNQRLDTYNSGVQHDLHGIVLLDAADAVIVGDNGTVLRPADSANSSAAPLVAVAEPSPWEAMQQTVTDRVLWSVWGSGASDVFAVGESGTIIHYDGGSWKKMASPSDCHLHGVWGSSARNVYAVGQIGTVLHYDGERWRQVYRLPVDITAVAITGFGPHDIFVVGDEGLILRFDGLDWQRMNSNTKDALYGVWGLDSEHVLAVGDFGTVLRWNGKDWKAFNAGTENFLYSVWGDALDNIFVVGLAGTIARFDGKQWSRMATRQRSDLLAVAGCFGRMPVVVGTLGTVLRYTGNHWSAERCPSDTSLRALWIAEDGTAFAVGDGGAVLTTIVSSTY